MFRAADPAVLRQVPLGEMTAIYDRRSGQTHVVADPVPEILGLIVGQPLDAAAIATRLGVEGAAELVAERLDELVAIGLVERA